MRRHGRCVRFHRSAGGTSEDRWHAVLAAPAFHSLAGLGAVRVAVSGLGEPGLSARVRSRRLKLLALPNWVEPKPARHVLSRQQRRPAYRIARVDWTREKG
jgi:hypothetical protein